MRDDGSRGPATRLVSCPLPCRGIVLEGPASADVPHGYWWPRLLRSGRCKLPLFRRIGDSKRLWKAKGPAAAGLDEVPEEGLEPDARIMIPAGLGSGMGNLRAGWTRRWTQAHRRPHTIPRGRHFHTGADSATPMS